MKKILFTKLSLSVHAPVCHSVAHSSPLGILCARESIVSDASTKGQNDLLARALAGGDVRSSLSQAVTGYVDGNVGCDILAHAKICKQAHLAHQLFRQRPSMKLCEAGRWLQHRSYEKRNVKYMLLGVYHALATDCKGANAPREGCWI